MQRSEMFFFPSYMTYTYPIILAYLLLNSQLSVIYFLRRTQKSSAFVDTHIKLRTSLTT